MTNYRDFLVVLVGLYQSLLLRLAGVDQEAAVLRFGAPVRKGRRLEVLDKWVAETLERFKTFWNVDAPSINKNNAQEVTRVLTNIARGLPSDARSQVARPPEMLTTHEALLWEEDRKRNQTITDRLDTLIFLQQAAMASSLNDKASTEALDVRCGEYLQDARTGESFDYVAYAIDRISLPQILRRREDEDGDMRAPFALEKLAQTETALVQRAVPDYDPNAADSAVVEDIKHVRSLVENLVQNDQENWKPFGDFMEFLARSVERSEPVVTAPAFKVPKQRTSAMEAEVRRIAAARANKDRVTGMAVGFSK